MFHLFLAFLYLITNIQIFSYLDFILILFNRHSRLSIYIIPLPYNPWVHPCWFVYWQKIKNSKGIFIPIRVNKILSLNLNIKSNNFYYSTNTYLFSILWKKCRSLFFVSHSFAFFLAFLIPVFFFCCFHILGRWCNLSFSLKRARIYIYSSHTQKYILIFKVYPLLHAYR